MISNTSALHFTMLHLTYATRNRIALIALLIPITFSAHAISKDFLTRAQHLQLTRQNSKAVSVYTQVLRTQPTLVAGWIGRGQSYLALGHVRAAFADFSQWQRLEPKNPYASIWLFVASLRNGGRKSKRFFTLAHGITTSWPQPVIRYLAGITDWETMFNRAEAATGSTRNRELCEAAIFYGEKVLAEEKMISAMGGFTLASEARCKPQAALQALAGSEYQKLYRAGYRPRPPE